MKVLSFDGARWVAQELDTEAARGAVAHDKLTWVRAGGLSAKELHELGDIFGLHPLTLEDVQNDRQRPKVESYPDLTFVVMRVPRWEDELKWSQAGLFLGRDFLITASSQKIPELDALEARLLKNGLPSNRPQVATLLHLALDLLVDAWFPYVDELEDYIDGLEDQVLERPDVESLATIREVKRVVSRTRKVSGPMREAMLSLERADHTNIDDDTRLYLRDISDHMVRIAERLEHVKEMALIAQESWNATLANNQNQQMKRLTVLFALFLIPTFAAGLGGMNFEGFPAWSFWPVTGTILSLVFIGLVVSLYKKWL